MGLRLASAALYVAFAAVGLAVIASPLVAALRAVLRPCSYAPDLAWPWLWIALAAGLVGLVAEVVRRLAAGRKAGLVRYGLLLALALGAVAARNELKAPRRPSVRDGLSAALARVAVAADLAFARAHAYPTEAAGLQASVPGAARDLGFRARFGRVMTTRVVVRKDALSALFAPDAAVRPGDLVFAVDPARRRYWLTAFGLGPRGGPALVVDESGSALLLTSVDGRPRSPLDDEFPDYPHKIPLDAPVAGTPP